MCKIVLTSQTFKYSFDDAALNRVKRNVAATIISQNDTQLISLYECIKDISFKELVDMFNEKTPFPDYEYDSERGRVIESSQDFFEACVVKFGSIKENVNCDAFSIGKFKVE